MVRRKLQMVVLVGLVATASLGFTGSAVAGGCGVTFSPNPGWRGATVTITLSGFGDGIYMNFNGAQIYTGNNNASFQYQIPMDAPNPSNYFVGSNGCSMNDSANYTVLASPPTTQPPPTTAPPTTAPPATTTTAASSTTTTAPDTTTTSLDDTTTTTEADDEGGGGQGWMLWVIIALVVAVALLAGMMLGQRRRAGNAPPPAE